MVLYFRKKGIDMTQIQTTEQSMELVEREFLFGRRARKPKSLNMQEVYDDIDNKRMSMEEILAKYEVSESTLRRHHKKYQDMIKKLKEQAEKEHQEENELPPLPPDL